MTSRTSGRGLEEAPSNPIVQLPHLLTIEDVADHLGVSVRHVRRLVAERRIPYVKWGHLIRFDPQAITTWIDGRRIAVGQGQGRSLRSK